MGIPNQYEQARDKRSVSSSPIECLFFADQQKLIGFIELVEVEGGHWEGF